MQCRTWRSAGFAVLLLCCLILASCKTTPPPPSYPPFYSPFREGGGLTAWANEAIKRGIGLQIHPNMQPYPDNRLNYDDSVSRKELEREGRWISERVARMIGGWDFVATTSDKDFLSVEELAYDLQNCSQEPRFAEALSAAMMLYPPLRAVYYPVSAGKPGAWGNAAGAQTVDQPEESN
ncbi:MAG: hypothetical protein GY851_02210 [bacterium]|nr:hypothetical protein [bacterium]